MKLFMDSPDIKIYQGHVLEVLKELPSKSVNCCVTSPPYYGLRDYGTDLLIWDAQEGCSHEWGTMLKRKNAHKSGETNPGKEGYTKNLDQWSDNQGQFCKHCGAWLGSLGLEPTPKLFVDHLVQVFREVNRVLTCDGTLWLNIGDSYAASGGSGSGEYQKRHKQFGKVIKGGTVQNPRKPPEGLKPKDLIGIPWMLGFALRADGWYLRQDIIWNKNSCMPESVRDRCTRSHEYIFLLSKSRKYYYNSEAIKEPSVDPKGSAARYNYDFTGRPDLIMPDGKEQKLAPKGKRNFSAMRNKRSVWTVNLQPYKDAHFAVFPEKLIEPCIKAGCPDGGVVLDPFFGSGTAGVVSRKLGVDCIGIDLKKEYCKLARDRIKQCGVASVKDLGMFFDVK